ncbi:hypothetical protein PIIN_10052 [Serendipita indica DSM 11827]|uniref:NACHT domain-containing protein n=1 Tax=Serendipita indica (strain DSM 11827) TaxID=1109443 RepID=G4TXK9_SERID|nr:hypothetical protein PIIN_10052 [Serendipita indica DSM 11827]
MLSIENQIGLFETYPPKQRAVDDAFSRPLIHYVESLEDLYQTVGHYQRRSFTTAAQNTKFDAGMIRKFARDIEDLHRRFMDALALFTGYRAQVIEQNTEVIMANLEATKSIAENTRANMQATRMSAEATKSIVKTTLIDADCSAILQLPMVTFVAESVHNTCLQGTREAVLQTIRHWVEDDISRKPIFWLCDIAGSGKSTVAMSIVEQWRKEGILGGQFFFSLDSNEASTTDKFCSTLAKELAQHMRELTPYIAQALKQNPAIMRNSLHDQLRNLLTGPLRHRQAKVVFVIDAVDECKSEVQRSNLLDALAQAARETKNLKIFITSRPDLAIDAVLGPLSIKAELKDRLHDVNHQDNIDDIAKYITHSLHTVLSSDKIDRLVKKASGLFIWASTACRMFKTSSRSPESIYNRLVSMQGGVIDDLYTFILEHTNPDDRAVNCMMLALLLAAYEPLTTNDLDNLAMHAKVDGSAKALVRNLGTVLTENQTTKLIQFRHPTFVEYLRRCSDAPSVEGSHKIHIDITSAHGHAASWCLKNLKSRTEGLKFNICRIESSFYLNRQVPDLDAKVSKFIPRRLQYASSHWFSHAADTDEDWRRTLKNDLQYILRIPYPLYWMEILSFTGRVSRAIAGLRALMAQTGLEEATRKSIMEMLRFMMAFLVPIQDSAPHIYISALPFTPTKSKLYQEGLQRYINTFKVVRGLEEIYPNLPRTLRGHGKAVNVVAFSPDGLQIASGSDDKKVRLWDVGTGQSLGEPIRGHDDSVQAVAFSPDGSRIISGSHDQTVRLWNADTGRSMGTSLCGHASSVIAVGFSPDGSRIVSFSKDLTIRFWDATTGRPLGKSFLTREESVNAIAFSLDGSRIAFGSKDNTIRLLDTNTGAPFGEPLLGHKARICAIAFSPDGSQIVSGSDDRTIRLWDTRTRPFDYGTQAPMNLWESHF